MPASMARATNQRPSWRESHGGSPAPSPGHSSVPIRSPGACRLRQEFPLVVYRIQPQDDVLVVLFSLLPGLREVRTPLTTGYIWLTLGVLAWWPRTPFNHPDDGLVSAAWDIGTYVGKAGLLVVASFAAYLIGALLEVDPLRLWQHGGRPKWFNRFRDRFRVPALQRVQVYPMSPEAQHDLHEYCRDEYTDLGNDADVASDLMREERQLATRLQAGNIDLYDKYDRLMAESSFRINVTPPTLILLIVLLWHLNVPDTLHVVATGCVLLGAGMFMRQGVRRAMQSRDIIVQSVIIGAVTPRFLSRHRRDSSTPSPSTTG